MTTSYDITTAVTDQGWVPATCALPTAEQPFRVAEFDDLFAESVRPIERIDPTTVELTLDAAAEDRARDLAARESECCSFFDFEFAPTAAGTVTMRVRVPAAQTAVLDAWAARAAALAS